MLITYILDKDSFCVLYEILGGRKERIPKEIYDAADFADTERVLRTLEWQGYIHRTDSAVNIERTLGFLMTSVINANGFVPAKNGYGCVFDCEKITIIVERDRISPKKIKIIPIMDSEMLCEYNAENEEENN